MQRQIFLIGAKAAHAGIVPDIGAIAPRIAKAKGFGMGRGANLVDKDQLMLGQVKRAHATIELFPDHQVLEL